MGFGTTDLRFGSQMYVRSALFRSTNDGARVTHTGDAGARGKEEVTQLAFSSPSSSFFCVFLPASTQPLMPARMTATFS